MSGKIGCRKEKSVEWYTPAWIFHRLGIDFDLDPASPHDFETPVPAQKKLTKYDDGLIVDWHGRVWMNPPYSRETPRWMRKFIDHGHGICLVFSRTDTRWFQEALKVSDATLFLSGRIDFIPGHENRHKKSRAGAGTAMFAFGKDCKMALQNLSDLGYFLCP